MSDSNSEKLEGPSSSGIGDDKLKIRAECDMTSEHFDPMIALYDTNLQIPKNVKIFDNVSKFEAVYNKTKEKYAEIQPASSKKRRNLGNVELLERRFLPHQGLVKTTGIQSRHRRNILVTMNQGIKGPLALLKTYMDNRTRVKILTRKEHGVRGHITGIIEAYDKHWNLVVSEVNEIWKRRKTYFSNTANYGSPQDCTKQLKKLGIVIPKIEVKSLNRKYVQCVRTVPQLLVRGEQIILIETEKPNSNQSADDS